MRNRDTAYLTMVSTTDKVLEKYEAVWKTNSPVARQVAAIREAYGAVSTRQQDSNIVSTGITEDKETAADKAITLAVSLSGFAQAYALEKEDKSLYAQVKENYSILGELADEELEQRLRSLHTTLKAVGEPLAEFEVTPARLDELLTDINLFAKLKTAPRLAITSRKTHNDSIPQLLSQLHKFFKILDKLLPNWEKTNPDFVKDYFNARLVIYRNGGGDTPEEKKSEA